MEILAKSISIWVNRPDVPNLRVAFCLHVNLHSSWFYVSFPPIFLSWGLLGMPRMLVPLVRIIAIILFVMFAVALVHLSL